MEDWERIFTGAAGELGCSITNSQLRLFALYRTELLRWNARMSLLSLKSHDDLPLKHFADSLTLLPVLDQFGSDTGQRVLDLGTGGGFPGIPLRIMRPSLELSLLDSSRKKSSFLKEALRKMDLSGVEVINRRMEEVISDGSHMESFDYVVSRATLSLERLIAPADHFLVAGGLLLAMKSRGADRELRDARGVPSNMEYRGRRDLELPGGAGSRTILFFRKRERQGDLGA